MVLHLFSPVRRETTPLGIIIGLATDKINSNNPEFLAIAETLGIRVRDGT